MKTLIFGANGFIGSSLNEQLSVNHEVYTAIRESSDSPNSITANMLDVESITKAIISVAPEVVINCAGVVENTERASLNVTFTRNMLDAIIASKVDVKKIVVLGSAAEYGIVVDDLKPISEEEKLNPVGFYGNSKVEEVKLALSYKAEHGLPVVIARIFNPIGLGMNAKFIIPNLLAQAKMIKSGELDTMSVGRLESIRDYIDVKDVSSAVQAIIENNTTQDIYNIGSGKSTSNKTLAELIIKNCNIEPNPRIIGTAVEPENKVASKADISRISNELGWLPVHDIETTIKEIIDE